MKVLLVDDEIAITAALSVRLRAAGYEVASASNGTTGLAAAAEHQPDVIILDIRMPDIDGFEVCRRLKKDPALMGIPVIFLSANVQDTARQTALEVGGAGFHSKPYDAAQLIATIQSVAAGDQAAGV